MCIRKREDEKARGMSEFSAQRVESGAKREFAGQLPILRTLERRRVSLLNKRSCMSNRTAAEFGI